MKTKSCIFILTLLHLAFVHHVSGQVPSINSFTPDQGPVGTTVTITGSNFSATPNNNIVYFGATRATVSSATATTLTVNVPLGATYQPITVTAGGLTAYSAVPFVATFDSNHIIDESSFASRVDFSTGTTPSHVALGDLDNDGKIDLATSNESSPVVSVFRNVSMSGTITSNSLESKVDFAAYNGPWGFNIGDIDGDGKQDMVAIDNGRIISIFKNTTTSSSFSSASFAAKADYDFFAIGVALTEVAIGDLDSDGKPDLAITDQTGNRVSVFKNTSAIGVIDANSFTSKVDFETGTSPRGIAIADLDGDGKPELATANSISNTVSVFRNISSIGIIDANSFAPKTDFFLGVNNQTVDISVGDLDGDKKPDIAVANFGTNTVSVLKNTTTIGTITTNSFEPKVDFATATGPMTIAMGDLDGDGKLELAIASLSIDATDVTSNKISVLKNTTTADVINGSSFAPNVNFMSKNPISVTIGDIDGDGKPDLTVSNYYDNTISILRNKDSQTITSFTSISDKKMGDSPFSLLATASSDLPVQFIAGSDLVTISENQVTIIKPGSVTISAEQPGNNTISAAPKVSQTFCINPATPSISINITNPAEPILTSSSDFGNQWYLNETLLTGATSKTFTVKDEGVYKVKVVVDGCMSPLSEGETLIITGDIINNASDKVQLFPNPAHDVLRVQLSGFKESDKVSVIMIDDVGKTITRHIGIGGDELEIDIKNNGNGLYYLKMMQGSKTQYAKFIKQ